MVIMVYQNVECILQKMYKIQTQVEKAICLIVFFMATLDCKE